MEIDTLWMQVRVWVCVVSGWFAGVCFLLQTGSEKTLTQCTKPSDGSMSTHTLANDIHACYQSSPRNHSCLLMDCENAMFSNAENPRHCQ